MNVNKIEVGDKVDFHSLNSGIPPIRGATVLHIAQATGDSWTLKAKDNEIFEVQNFEFLRLVEKAGLKGMDYTLPAFQIEENMK